MAKEVAQLMDELGYYCLWTAEHHFQHEGYECFPNLILLSTWLATQPAAQVRLRLQRAADVAPVRLAEDYAMADIMTGGRVIMGVGAATTVARSRSFGAPMIDNAANKELFEEQMEVLSSASTRSPGATRASTTPSRRPVEYRGYPLKEVTCVPRPIHRPVELWQPIASGRTLEYIAQRGIKGMVDLNGEQIFRQVAEAYRDAAGRAGRELAARRGPLSRVRLLDRR